MAFNYKQKKFIYFIDIIEDLSREYEFCSGEKRSIEIFNELMKAKREFYKWFNKVTNK